MVDNTGVNFDGQVYAYIGAQFARFPSTGGRDSSFEIKAGEEAGVINVSGPNTPIMIDGGKSTMEAEGTVTSSTGQSITFAPGSRVEGEASYDFYGEDGKLYWLTVLSNGGSSSQKFYISNYPLESGIRYTVEGGDGSVGSGGNSYDSAYGNSGIRIDDAIAPDAPSEGEGGSSTYTAWSGEDITISGTTLSLDGSASSGTFTSTDNDDFLRDQGSIRPDYNQIGSADVGDNNSFSDASYNGDVAYRVENADGDVFYVIEVKSENGDSIYVSTGSLIPGEDYTISVVDNTPGFDDGTVSVGDEIAINYSDLVVAPATPTPNFIVEGTDSNDLIDANYTGDPEGDMVDANDNQTGNNDDSIVAGAGDDTIRAGEGDDTVDAGTGDDSIEGGAGDDSIIGHEGSDTVDGGEGDDFINTRTSPGNGTPDQGFTHPDDAQYSYPADVAGAARPGGGTFGGPDDDRDSIDGGSGNDTILSGDDDDTISGGSGSDVIDAGFDDDSVAGGSGADSIQGSEGNDTIDGGADDDVIYGGVSPLDPNYAIARNYDLEDAGVNTSVDPVAGNNGDLLLGGAGNDRLYGQDDGDTLLGGEGNDSLDGGIDDDTLDGGDGNDTLVGGQGNDLFIISSGNDTIVDFGGGETGSLEDRTEASDNDDQENNDFVDLSGHYNWSNYNSAVSQGQIDPTQIKNPLEWLRADQTDDGVLNDTAAGWSSTSTLTLLNSDAAVDASELVYDRTNVVCFVRGSMIMTDVGEIPVEELRPGSQVLTLDAGLQAIRWIGKRKLNKEELIKGEHLYPIKIESGALGSGLPKNDLWVSPQHRLLVNGSIVERMFGDTEVLIAAKHLTGLEGVYQDRTVAEVEYWHFLLNAHQIVVSNGAYTETLFTGSEALKTIPAEALGEIFSLFPQLEQADGKRNPEMFVSARKIIGGRPARSYARRVHKNNKSAWQSATFS